MTHPNKSHFIGVLTKVDEPSNKAPSGARGHTVVLTKQAAMDAIPSLLGMGVCFHAESKHVVGAKIGVIDTAELHGNELVITGYLFARDVPQIVSQIRASAEYGMSYELADAHVEDMRAAVWYLTKVTFTGAAILPRCKAAYRTTDFVLVD